MMRRVRFISKLMCAAVLLWGMVGCGYIAPRNIGHGPAVEEGEVVFRFYFPAARRVQLGGSWPENNWGEGLAQTGSYLVGLMEKNPQTGTWARTECLAPGRYEYKFRIDELNWKEDPNNPQRVDDSYGGFNSLLIVE